MKSEELKIRLQKAEENIEKRKATIERQKAQLEKKRNKVAKVGWIDMADLSKYKRDVESRNKYETETKSQLYWDICDIEHKEEEIKDSYKKLAELEQIAKNWKEKLEKAEFNEDFWKREIPESLKSYRTYLTTQWDEYDKSRRDTLKAKYEELGRREFMKRHKYAGFTFMSITDEEIHKENEKDATTLILDLYGRVFKYTGKIVSWEYLTIHQGHINGWVKGEKTNVRVESILAGGYNIQRLHVRVLVREYKEELQKVSDSKDELPKISKDYKRMSITELEELADSLNVTCKKYDNQAIYRMRLTMAIKNATIKEQAGGTNE